MKAFNNPTNYQTLFPNEEYNNITEEYSIYGPGAYLVYLLNIATDNKFVAHADEQKDLELLNRRPDLNLLQINADNNTKKHYYLEGVVNVLMNTLNGWESTDKNSWKKTSDKNQLWQNLASGIGSFIPYNRVAKIIKNRLEKAEFSLSDITAKLHTESYENFSWVYSRLGLNYFDVEILKSGGGDVSTWLKNNRVSINKLFYSNSVIDKELFALINNQVFLSFFGMNEISISHNENEVFLNIQEGDLKKLRCFIILGNATQWKYNTLIAVLQTLEIKEFTKENTVLQLKNIARLSLIAEVFEDVKSAEFLNTSLIKNRLTSVNLSFTNKAIQDQSTSEDKILDFLRNLVSNNVFNRFSGRIQSLFTSISSFNNNQNTISLGGNIQLTTDIIAILFKLATFIKRFQQTGHTADELANYIALLTELNEQTCTPFNNLVEQLLSDIYLFVESKDFKEDKVLVDFENDLHRYISNALAVSWGVDELIVSKYMSEIDISKEIIDFSTSLTKLRGLITDRNCINIIEEKLKITSDFKEKFNKYFTEKFVNILKAPYSIVAFAKTFRLSEEVTAICISDLSAKKIIDNKDLIAFFEYSIGVLHLQKYLDESTEDNGDLIKCLSEEKITIEHLIQKIAQREKCNPLDVTTLFHYYRISESEDLDKAALYETLYKVSVYAKIYEKFQLSTKDTFQLIDCVSNAEVDIDLYRITDSLLTDDLYGKQLMADRDILVPLVFHKLSEKYEDITNSDRLSEYLLMDVQVSDQIKIIPIREAINAVQWYMANAKSGLEDVDKKKLSKITTEEWLYIEKFRVWQAEQKLKLYPNEYFQIDNLENTSELYQQLKLKLQGDKISSDLIDSLLKDYLEKWSNLSNNEIVASYYYRLNNKNYLCLVAKCSNEENTFYCLNTEINSKSKLINTSEWKIINTQIDADINSLNIIYAFNRIYIFYARLSESNSDNNSNNESKKYLIETCSVSQDINGNWGNEKKWNTSEIENKERPFSFKPILFFTGDSIIIHLAFLGQINASSDIFNSLIYYGYRPLFRGEISVDNKISYNGKEFKFETLWDELIPLTKDKNGKKGLITRFRNINNQDFFLLNQSLFSYESIECRGKVSSENKSALELKFDVFDDDSVYINNINYRYISYRNFLKIGGINGFIFNSSLNTYLIVDKKLENVYSCTEKKGAYDITNEGSHIFNIIPIGNKFSLFLKNLVGKEGLATIYNEEVLKKDLNNKLFPESKINYNQTYTYALSGEISPQKNTCNATKYIRNSTDTLYAKEFFVYIPCLIASYLRNNLQYEEAVKWLEKVFNPYKREEDVLQYFFDQNDKDKELLNKWLFEQYVNTLFDWADNEYRIVSWESINHATQLYLQVEDLLGEEIIICNANQKLDQKNDRSFSSIKNKENDYFGTPSHNTINELIKKVQGRLYNLRNGLNIDGSRFTPSEYGTVIDPVSVQLLRKANSLDSHGLQSLQDKKRIYQFRDLMLVTESIIDTIIQFGNQFYSILQQKDNEEIQLLMHTQTMAAELFVTQNFELQIQEIELQLNALQTNRKSAQLQLAYYNSLLDSGIIEQERSAFTMQHEAHNLQLAANTIRTGAAIAHLLPNTFGLANGGMKFGDAIEAVANVTDTIAHNKILKAQLITDEAEAKRRALDLAKEISISVIHLEEIAINIQATEKRLQIIKSNLAEHKMRIVQQQTMLDHLTTKFTNVDLYSWMSTKLSSLYFSVYQIGLRSLNQLQDSYNYELDHTDSFIPQNSWDSLKKGLLAGEALKLTLTQLKESYFRNNVRRKEVEKVISLRNKFESENLATDWENFISKGDEISFDLSKNDFYSNKSNRLRIKSLSVSVPGVVGPYETFDITLKNNVLDQEIEISRGINDFGVFPESMNDGRYMPFEGFEITEKPREESKEWKLTRGKEKQSQISDIILTVRLTIL